MAGDPGLILYVDDEWTNRVVFEQTFGPKYRIKTVASGSEALEVMANEPVAVLVTDQRMPEMSGNDLLKRARELHPRTIRVVLTAYGDLEPILASVNQGLVARYVVKPWVRTEFESVLRWGLDAWEHSEHDSEVQLRLLKSERLITLGVVASSIFHDIGQPIAQLRENVDRLRYLAASADELAELLKRHARELPEPHRTNVTDLASELPELVQDLDVGTKVIDGIHEQMDRILRARARPGEITDRPMDVVRYALSIFEQRTAHVQLVYEGPPELPRLKIPLSELAQILVNLVSNAVQAMPPRPVGPRTVGKVVVTAVEEADRVRFTVVDDGKGMPPEVLAKAGTLFFSTRDEGAGLGLAQVKRLVEQAQGVVSMESTLGSGTRIGFTIPKA